MPGSAPRGYGRFPRRECISGPWARGVESTVMADDNPYKSPETSEATSEKSWEAFRARVSFVVFIIIPAVLLVLVVGIAFLTFRDAH